ncbi:MAG: hypothetical protein QM697_04990 [Lachnospiraceae bacterium]
MKTKGQTKRHLIAAGLAVLLVSGCIGCGSRPDILSQEPVIPLKERNENNTEEAEDTVSSVSYPQNPEGAAGSFLGDENTDMENSNVTVGTADSVSTVRNQSTGGAAVAQVVSTQLTEEDLAVFTDYFNNGRVNGFLSCSYEVPSQIDLTAVLKSSGAAGGKLSLKEQTEASMLFGKTERIDVIKYSSAYLEELLHEMTGLGLSEINRKPDCAYSSDYDAYYIKKSDAALHEITCTAGSVDDDGIYSIFYIKAGNEGLWNVIVRENDSGFFFHSNASLGQEN